MYFVTSGTTYYHIIRGSDYVNSTCSFLFLTCLTPPIFIYPQAVTAVCVLPLRMFWLPSGGGEKGGRCRVCCIFGVFLQREGGRGTERVRGGEGCTHDNSYYTIIMWLLLTSHLDSSGTEL